ncbi:hypothetical protein CL656_05350 [bacterium]|nr:hypothetical protein [bacterium]|tara:strand:+ start:8556 stop:9326 length:771 start_codon:yes stop_codon:yes gene_type:complete
MKILNFLILILLFVSNNSFIISYKRTFNNNLKKISVLEPKNIRSNDTECIIFFTGGNSFILPDIYSNFLKSLVNKNISIYIPPFNYKNMNDLIELLCNEYKKVTMMGHSSGCSMLLNNCKSKNIKDIILLDPVNTRIINKKKYDISNIKNVYFLNADKSYRVSFDPFGLPFIPFLKITKNKLFFKKNKCNFFFTDAFNYGHSDILNKRWSDFMHNIRLSVGNSNRTIEKSIQYHNKLANNINFFIREQYKKISSFI